MLSNANASAVCIVQVVAGFWMMVAKLVVTMMTMATTMTMETMATMEANLRCLQTLPLQMVSHASMPLNLVLHA